MADAKILSSVKQALGNTGTYQDGALNVYIDEIISYMVGAGVPESVANSTASAGVIALGVTDLQYRGGKPSAYFYERVSQLNYEVDTEAEALKKEVAALQEQIATEQKEIETLQRELETAQSASNNLRAEVTELERQIAAKQAEIEALTQEKAVLERLVDELRAENETLKAQAETVEQQHNAEKAEMQKQHNEEVAALEQAHAAEVEELERTHAEQVAELEEENATIAETSYNDGANAAKNQFGIPNEVTGTGLVTLDYVNENEHNVEVKLSSDTVADFSGVEVSVYSKNFLNSNGLVEQTLNGVTFTPVYTDGLLDYILVNGTATNTVYYHSNWKLGVPKYLVDNYDTILSGTKSGCNIIFYSTGSADFGGGATIPAGRETNGSISLKVYKDTTVSNVKVYPMLRLATEKDATYEPYDKKTYTANADGTVDGVINISPTMNIVCEGVDITAKYYCVHDVEWQKFWDKAQAYGKRTNYAYFVCANFSSETLNPKYDIQPIVATSMFTLNNSYKDMLLKNIPNVFPSGAKLDFSKAANLNSLFHSNDMVRTIGIIDTTAAATLQDVFRYASNVISIEKFIFKADGSQTLTRPFDNMNNLQNIVIEGAIGKSVSFQWSTKLTHDSLMSIINALQDKSEDTSGTTWTLTIGSGNIAKLDETTELDIAWQKGWEVK
jgi:chemotaxis protein histidine kinase CheA